jgi:hypothetical protein
MNNKRFILIGFGTIIIVLAITVFSISLHGRATPGIPDTDDSKQIQEAIKLSYHIEAEAIKTHDTSLFSTVYVNDPGIKLSPSTIQFVRNVKKNENLTNIGFLDYKIAYYTSWIEGTMKYNELVLKAAQEGRELSKEEIESLRNNYGVLSMARGDPSPAPLNLKFDSITINSNEANAIFDDGPRTNQMKLVKINGKWYIADWVILSIHP